MGIYLKQSKTVTRNHSGPFQILALFLLLIKKFQTVHNGFNKAAQKKFETNYRFNPELLSTFVRGRLVSSSHQMGEQIELSFGNGVWIFRRFLKSWRQKDYIHTISTSSFCKEEQYNHQCMTHVFLRELNCDDATLSYQPGKLKNLSLTTLGIESATFASSMQIWTGLD